jgi:broad specificity phosphatase PhoE
VSIDGCESADAALARFERAVNRQLNLCSVPVLAVVSHGIVLTLYLASQLGKAPDFSLWQALRMPDYAVIDLHPWQMIKPFGEPQPATVVPA